MMECSAGLAETSTTRGGLSPRRRPAPGRRLLDIQDLHCRRGNGVRAYHVALPELRLATGEVIALTGASGSGKSTLLEVLGLAAPPARAGRFLWCGGEGALDLVALWRRGTEHHLAGLRAARIGFVMQTGGLLPFLTVRENLLINRRLLGMPEQDDHVTLIVDSLELGELLGALPAALSVGQQQRASIGRALAHQPALLLADEPTSALDPRLADRVLSLLLDLARRSGTAVVLATHEHGRVRSLALRRFAAELEPAADDAPPAARFVEPAA